MPATINATLLAKYKSFVRSTTACTAGLTSEDVLTVNHQLGVSPTQIVVALRSIRGTPSNSVPALVVESWDATKATCRLAGGPGVGAVSADFDIVFENTHSFSR